jgi:TldD protein
MEIDSFFRDAAARALNICEVSGADYADIRIVQTHSENFAASNGRLTQKSESSSVGFGIRVLIHGSWGFASSNHLTIASVESTCKKALALGKASASITHKKVNLGQPVVSRGKYHTPLKIDPFSLSAVEKVSLLLDASAIMQKVPGIVQAGGSMEFIRREKYLASSEGSQIEQVIFESGAGLSATAAKAGNFARRTFPTNLVRQQGTGGYELVQKLNLLENAQLTAEEAVQMLGAVPCPQGEYDLVCDPSLLVHILHEIVGHNTELDRILGDEMGYAGTSFVPKDLSQKFQYASPLVNIYLDSTFPEGLGTFGFDDEGVPAQRADLIKDGYLVGFHTSRESASQIGQTSNACMRADGYNRIPIIRMTNIILASVNQSWSIDDRRKNFDYTAQYGYEIKNGRLGKMVKRPAFRGDTLNFWKSCDAVCNQDEFRLYGLPICGKGEPWQGGPISHGCSPARFKNVQLGM